MKYFKMWNINKKSLLSLIYNVRYLNSLNIFSFQYLDPCLTKNVIDHFDYIFIFKVVIDKEKYKIYEKLNISNLISFEIFKKLVESLDNYESLVIDCNNNKFFLYKYEYENSRNTENVLIENKTFIDYLKSLFK